MERENVWIELSEILQADIPELTEVMTRAFDDDAQKHLGQEKGGPEGYDDGEFFRKWLFGYQESVGYKIVMANQVIGGLIVWILPGGHHILGTIFVDPAYQDRGLGRQAWGLIEQLYPETLSWRLATPTWATKNHTFYQKCGFRKVNSDPLIPPEEGSTIYYKEMKGSNSEAAS
jgi:GNAT superfamily N-acetyltransferase